MLRSKFRKLSGRIVASYSSLILKRIITTTSSSSLPIAPKEKVDCVVIGAGVVGIAIARELALNGREVLVLDSASTFGTATSSRNSEVIHAGIYYPHTSLKAHCCVRGRELLYKYCSEHEVPHRQIGKLIVATRYSEIPLLNDLIKRGIKNGVHGLMMMEGNEAMRMEPELQCVQALWSPCSGIVDTHNLMLSMVGGAENHRASFSYNTAVIGAHLDGNRICLHISDTKAIESINQSPVLHPQLLLLPNLVVNSAGLGAISIAKRFNGLDTEIIPTSFYARGCYFTLPNAKTQPFKHLIYPMPEDGGIGVHVTLNLEGQVKFGPDVEWIDGLDDVSSFLNKFDYSVCAKRAGRFYSEIRKYYPTLPDESLEAGYSGIRPKLSGPGQPPTDFIIQGEEIHGIAGLINLFGIESPGLTASLGIAEHLVHKYLKI